MTRLATKLLATLLSGALLLALPSGNASAATKVSLAYAASQYSAQVMVARDMGYFAKHDVDLDPKIFSVGRLALDAMLGGATEMSTTAETPITAAVMSHQPIAILARLATAVPQTLVRVDAKIDTPADLRGKKIAITAGTGSEVYTYTLLQKAGLKPSDVTFVSLRAPDMPAALLNHSVDAISTYEPYISNAQKLLGAKAKLLNTAGTYSETWNLVTTPDYLKSNAAAIENVLRALIDAEDFIDKNPEKAIDMISHDVGVDRSAIAGSWSAFHFKIAVDPAIVAILDQHSKWRLATGNHPPGVTTIPDFKKVIFAGPLKAVASDRVSPGF